MGKVCYGVGVCFAVLGFAEFFCGTSLVPTIACTILAVIAMSLGIYVLAKGMRLSRLFAEGKIDRNCKCLANIDEVQFGGVVFYAASALFLYALVLSISASIEDGEFLFENVAGPIIGLIVCPIIGHLLYK